MRLLSVESDQAKIAWSIPRSDGGAPIRAYAIELREQGAYTSKLVSGFARASKLPVVKSDDPCEYTLTKLRAGGSFNVRVIAINEIGESEPADLDETVTIAPPLGIFT